MLSKITQQTSKDIQPWAVLHGAFSASKIYSALRLQEKRPDQIAWMCLPSNLVKKFPNFVPAPTHVQLLALLEKTVSET